MRDPILSVFVSYSSKDKAIAAGIVKALRSSKARVWFDNVSITPGTTIIDEINRGIEKAHILILVVSKHSTESAWVNYEWKSFLDQRLRSMSPIFLIPAFLGKVAPPPPLAKYRGVKLSNAIRGRKDLVNAVNELAAKCAAEKRGFEMLASDQVDRIVNRSVSILKQTTTISPLSRSLATFDCYHWQEYKGQINLIRHDMFDQASGNAIPHTVRIKEKTSNAIRFQYRFKLSNLGPISLVHEIRCKFYFSNLFALGYGYSEFPVRYPMERFSYFLVCPNEKPFARFRVTIKRSKKQVLRDEIVGGERQFSYVTRGVKAGDKLRFVVTDHRIRK